MIILFSTKVNLPYLLYSSVQRCCLLYLINQNYLWETFLSNLAVASSCQIELLDNLQKWIYRTITSSLAASLDPFAYRWNIARLSLFCRYYFGRCSSELAALIPLVYSRGRSTRCFDRLHDFSVNIPRCYKDVYVNSFFPWPTKLWNSLPIKCFPLTYDINGFKSPFNCKFFLNRFPVCFNLFFLLLFLVTTCLVQSCMEWIPIFFKKTLFFFLVGMISLYSLIMVVAASSEFSTFWAWFNVNQLARF